MHVKGVHNPFQALKVSMLGSPEVPTAHCTPNHQAFLEEHQGVLLVAVIPTRLPAWANLSLLLLQRHPRVRLHVDDNPPGIGIGDFCCQPRIVCAGVVLDQIILGVRRRRMVGSRGSRERQHHQDRLSFNVKLNNRAAACARVGAATCLPHSDVWARKERGEAWG